MLGWRFVVLCVGVAFCCPLCWGGVLLSSVQGGGGCLGGVLLYCPVYLTLYMTCGEPVCTAISDGLLPLTADTCLSNIIIYQKGETIVALSANKKSKRENS